MGMHGDRAQAKARQHKHKTQHTHTHTHKHTHKTQTQTHTHTHTPTATPQRQSYKFEPKGQPNPWAGTAASRETKQWETPRHTPPAKGNLAERLETSKAAKPRHWACGAARYTPCQATQQNTGLIEHDTNNAVNAEVCGQGAQHIGTHHPNHPKDITFRDRRR